MLRQQLKEKYNPEIKEDEIAHEKCNKIKETLSMESKLDNNSFDPCKMSPPNDFLLKLRERIYNYEQNNLMLTKK